jgi:iron-sulfur cluster protein
MQDARDLKEYRAELREALDNEFLRQAMDKFALAYPLGRAKAFTGMDADACIRDVAKLKDASIGRLDELYEEFKKNAEAAGAVVHLAKTAAEANTIIGRIAQDNGVKTVVKSKSMTAEETHLNKHLEAIGLEVTETDLGEWIIQLRREGPTHMVMPAIHLSRYQVADLFTEVAKKKQDADIEKLVKVARRELRRKFAEADMGISGANFAISETGTIAIATNEGNGRLVTTLPRVHVALVGLDKLTPTFNDALSVMKVLPRNATGQVFTSYFTLMTGPSACGAAADGKKIMHIVFLDNGRRGLAKDPIFSEVLRCIRCGACANVCPVYRMVGGHKYGHIYIGAIGLILTYFFHGRDKAKNLVQNCINCGACKAVCASGIDLPRLIKEVYARIQDEEGHPLASSLLAATLKNRTLFHGLLRAARYAQRPATGGTSYLRHLPMLFAKDQGFRALPAIAAKPFRDMWPSLKPVVRNPRLKVALFSGCVLDFVYPEQLVAAVKVLADRGVEVDFPMGQSCCGLPVQMMGEKEASRSVALQNLTALDPAAYDYVLTLCASCASHIKHNYPHILEAEDGVAVKVQSMADRVIDFSSFTRDVLGLKEEDFRAPAQSGPGPKIAYHAPCHLCRGLKVREQPRALLKLASYEYVEAAEEEVCCGFGGTFSMKFPELSAELLKKKLDAVEATGATLLTTDCPGCVMQLRGGAERRGGKITVKHVSEVLADRMKGR